MEFKTYLKKTADRRKIVVGNISRIHGCIRNNLLKHNNVTYTCLQFCICSVTSCISIELSAALYL
jgi:hypothetical protein